MKNRRIRALRVWLRGLAAAVLMTLIGMLLLCAAVVFLGLSDGGIKIANQVLKVLSAALGTFCAVRPGGERGLITGAGVGVTYAVAGYCLYALTGGTAFSLTELLGEMLICIASGAVCGVICSNLKPLSRGKAA